MSPARFVLVGAMLLVALNVAWPARSAAADEAGARVTYDAQSQRLGKVVGDLADAARVRIRVPRAVSDQPISVSLNDVPLRLALRIIADVADLVVDEADSGFVLRPRSEASDPGYSPLAPLPDALPPLDRGQLAKRRIELTQARPSQVAGYFGGTGLVQTADGVELRPAPDVAATLATGCLGLAGEPSERCRQMVAEAQARFARRWRDPAGPAELAERGCGGGALPVPAGIRAVIGFDLHDSLIVVGDPIAVDTFAGLAEQFNVAPQPVRLDVRFFIVPAGELTRSELRWDRVGVSQNRVAYRVARGSADSLAASLQAAANGLSVESRSLVLNVAQPAVVSFTCCLENRGPLDRCNLPPDLQQDVESIVTTTDLKIVPWITGRPAARTISLLIDPLYGEVMVAAKDGQAGDAATLATAVPCTSTTMTVTDGQAVALAGVQPLGGFRAPGACPLLARLPFVGPLYNLNPVGPDEPVLVLLLTAGLDQP